MNRRAQVEAARADRAVIERAAAQLRRDAIRAGYAGLQRQDVAFSLALVLDELARHLRDLPDGVRRQAVASAVVLAGADAVGRGG